MEKQTAAQLKKGLCVVFSTMYAHLRIMNPGFTRKEVLDHVMMYSKKPMFMKRYITYVNQIMDS